MLKIKIENNGIFKASDDLSSGYDVSAIGYARVVSLGNSYEIGEHILLDDNCGFYIEPNETVLIKTGVYLELPKPIDRGDYFLILEAQVRGRSGLSLKQDTNVKLGTVDNNYRGECGVIFKNESKKPLFINKYDRVAQIVFNEVVKFKEIKYVNKLNETKRMSDGFGSTGI